MFTSNVLLQLFSAFTNHPDALVEERVDNDLMKITPHIHNSEFDR